jgi:hypothetical protein
VNGTVNAAVELANGDVVIGGTITAAGGNVVSNVARFDAASGAWRAMGGGVDGIVYALAVIPGGDVIVGGSFGYVNGSSSSAGALLSQGIARYRPSSDSWMAAGGSVSGTVKALAVMPNGDVMAGGSISLIGAVSNLNLARYHPATNTWTASVPAPDSTVSTLAILSNGDVMVGGQFQHAGGLAIRYLARYVPSTDTWSDLGWASPGYTTPVSIGALQGGDMVVWAGSGGIWRRWNSVPGVWVDSVPGTNLAYLITSRADGAVFGLYYSSGSRLSRFNAVNNTWMPIALSPSNPSLIAPMGNGDFVMTGYFASLGTNAFGIGRYSVAAQAWGAMGKATDGAVSGVATLGTGEIIAGGSFTTIGNVSANRVARRGRFGGAWSPLGSGVDGAVLSVLGGSGAEVIVGGSFLNAGGVSAPRVARFDVASGVWSSLGGGADGSVNALARLGNGDVVAGGNFIHAGSVVAQSVAVYRAANGSWQAMGAGVDGTVNAVVELPGGAVLVGGQFASAGGIAAGNLARYDFATQTWTSAGGTAVGTVNALAALASGDVEVAAGASLYRYSTASNQVLASSGGFGASGSAIRAMAALPSGEVVVGGTFLDDRFFPGVGYVHVQNALKLNAAGSVWSAMPAGIGDVRAMSVLPGGDVMMAGSLSSSPTYGFVGTATVRSVCAADFDCSGSLGSGDIFAYLNAWFAGDPRAEFDGVAGLTTGDVLSYLSAWFVGC